MPHQLKPRLLSSIGVDHFDTWGEAVFLQNIKDIVCVFKIGQAQIELSTTQKGH